MATINLTANSAIRYTQLIPSDVIISNPDSNAVSVNTPNVTILVDTAPVLSSTSAQSVDENSTLNFTVYGSDVDDNSLSYSTTYMPNGASFDTSTSIINDVHPHWDVNQNSALIFCFVAVLLFAFKKNR